MRARAAARRTPGRHPGGCSTCYSADRDADAVRDDLLGYVREHLGHTDGVLVVNETGSLKKGATLCGVARQYPNTAGRIESGQIGVFRGHATKDGRARLDRAVPAQGVGQ
ncbi:MAG: transposase [Planctomycetes bacterium]|nr:transposase [Planctomycetota bacterium]